MVRNVAFAISNVNSQCDISGRYTQGMSRRDALKRLIDERYGGKQADLARAINRSPSLVWQCLNGHRNIGEKLAREIESKLRLKKGWLDDMVVVDEAHKAGEPAADLSRQNDGALENAPVIAFTATPKKAKADELEFFGHMDAWDSNTPLDEDEVELPLFREVELAAGGGATQVIENHGAKLRFAKSTLSRAGVPAEAAACAFVRGNSMEPVMPDGTCVGVNTADKTIKDGEIYAIDHGGMLRVKYLHRRPGGGIKIVSQNASEHPVEEVTAEDMAANVRVIGRVFWWSVLR